MGWDGGGAGEASEVSEHEVCVKGRGLRRGRITDTDHRHDIRLS